MAAPDVLVVGDVMIDVGVEAATLARGGDVHGRVSVRPGGGGANAAVWAARAGARVRLHGRVGDDVPGMMLRQGLQQRGVEIALAVDPSLGTGAMLVVSEADERSMVSDPGANARLRPEDLPAELDAGCVLISGYVLFRPGSEPAARAALDRARAKHVAVDAASWPLLEAFGARRFLDATFGADLLLANEKEAEMLTEARGQEAARRLGDRFPVAVVKLGAGGAFVVAGGEVQRVPGAEAHPIDATGAGDAFDGTLLAGLAAGASMSEAAARACEAGAEATTVEGAWPPG
jgi:sugar/nucleoside kinase (ribokinase family)